MSRKAKAVILLSGGLDSATTSAIARSEGFEVYPLTFSYGQRHEAEIAAARLVAGQLKLEELKICHIDLRSFGGSALTSDIAVPINRSPEDMTKDIPVTYVPARNTIFLSFALAYAEVIGANDIYLGVNVLDYSGYPDCRPEFIAAFQTMARLATRAGVSGAQLVIHTPLIALTKGQIIKRGLELGVDYSKTVSCYKADLNGIACGRCDSCVLRLKGFEENCLTDPAPYARA